MLSFARRDPKAGSEIAVILNLTPVLRRGYRLGLSRRGRWREALNSDAQIYGGSNAGNLGGVIAEPVKSHGQVWSAEFTLPPLSIMAFIAEEPAEVPVIETAEESIVEEQELKLAAPDSKGKEKSRRAAEKIHP